MAQDCNVNLTTIIANNSPSRKQTTNESGTSISFKIVQNTGQKLNNINEKNLETMTKNKILNIQ